MIVDVALSLYSYTIHCRSPMYILNVALFSGFVAAFADIILGHATTKRDDNLPARVPYIFPAPGTNPVSTGG